MAFPVAMSALGNRQDAYDAAQECALRFYRIWQNLDQSTVITAYVYRIAVNCAVDVMRREKKRLGDKSLTELQDIGRDPSVDPPDITRIIDGKDNEDRLYECLETLTGKYHEAVWLRGLQEMSLQEMADKMGLNHSAAKNYYYRGRAALLKCLRERERRDDRNVEKDGRI